MYRHIYTKSCYYFYTFSFIFSGKRIYFISSSQNELISRSTLSIVTKSSTEYIKHINCIFAKGERRKRRSVDWWRKGKKNIINETFVPMDWEVLFILGCEVAPHKKKGFWEKGNSDNLNISLKSLCNSLSWIHTAWTEESSCFFLLFLFGLYQNHLPDSRACLK